MSGWTLESDSHESMDNNMEAANIHSRPTSSKARHAFFADEDEDDSVPTREVGPSLKRRDSMTLASSCRSNKGTRTEVVLVDSDEEQTETSSFQRPERTQLRPSSKVDELAVPDIAVRQVPSIEQQYAHLLVREFLLHKYGNNVVAMFDSEAPATIPSSVQSVHIPSLPSGADSVFSTKLEQLIAVWDTVTHHAQYSTQSSQLKTVKASLPEKPKASSKSSSRKKPTLSVTISADVPESSSGSKANEETSEMDYNRLNHPGHTPKAQSALMSAVMGKPGSTPKASVSELRALGFSDVEEEVAPILTSPSLIGMENLSCVDLDMNSELSCYAQRKRALKKHNKKVYIGESGRTPTKEYVFFRATPPQFVTETIEEAEQVVRDLGGDPLLGVKPSSHVERFIELQSSDVSKYRVGQQVERLGAQRNVSGIVSKLYGSRQCGTAGPGTIVIDSWYDSDMPPEKQMEEDTVAIVREEDGTDDSSSSMLNVYLSDQEDDAMIAQLLLG